MKKPSGLDKEIERLEDLIADLDPATQDYLRILIHIEKLHEIRSTNKKFKLDISGDTLVAAGVNILGILLVLKHEQFHAISSKAFGFISKARI